MAQRKFSFKTFTSFILVWTFIALVISGAVLYISPPGRVANWDNWKLIGVTKEGWQSIHVLLSIVFLIGGFFHLLKFNWKVFLHYFRQKRDGSRYSREVAGSLILFFAVLIGTMIGLPPFSSVMEISENVKATWEAKSTSAPIPHMELVSLQETSRQLELPFEQAEVALANLNIEFETPEQTLQEIGSANSRAPREIYDILKEASPSAGKSTFSYSGIGRKSVAEVAEGLGIPLDQAIDNLKKHVEDVTPETKMRDLATELSVTPHSIVELIKGEPLSVGNVALSH